MGSTKKGEGALLGHPVEFGEALAPFEFRVVEVTDQGKTGGVRIIPYKRFIRKNADPTS